MKKQTLIACILAFIAGILFLIAAPQYAEYCTLKTPPGETVLSAAMAIPAIAFTFAGCVGIIGSILAAVLALKGESAPSPTLSRF